MTELEFELEFKKRKLQKRKQRRIELLISVWGITARGQKTAGCLKHSAGRRLPGRYSHSYGCQRNFLDKY